MKIEIGKVYYWRRCKKDYWGYVQGFNKNGDVIVKDVTGELWVIPEDQLIE